MEDLVVRLRRYASQVYMAIDGEPTAKPRPADLSELATVGASAPLAQSAADDPASHESDESGKRTSFSRF